MTFAPEHDVPIPYMQRTRDYYLALGYGNPYRWAHFADVPFTPLAKPLAQSRVALITTAAPYQPGVGDQGPGREVQRRREVLQGLLRRDRRRARPAHLARRLRPHAHHGRGSEHLVSRWRALQRGREGGTDRRAHAALPRRADQPQPPGDDGDGRARSSCGGAARTAPTWPCSSPADRCVTRP